MRSKISMTDKAIIESLLRDTTLYTQVATIGTDAPFRTHHGGPRPTIRVSSPARDHRDAWPPYSTSGRSKSDFSCGGDVTAMRSLPRCRSATGTDFRHHPVLLACVAHLLHRSVACADASLLPAKVVRSPVTVRSFSGPSSPLHDGGAY